MEVLTERGWVHHTDLSHEEQNKERNEMRAVVLRPLRHTGIGGKIWIGLLIAVMLVGCYAYYTQLRDGLKVTAMRDYASWGLYISNFVFFVAISLVGALISSVLRLTNFEWHRPLTRIAEIIAVAGIMFAGLIIVVDMGRPDRILYLFTHGRIQSPIVWDVIVVSTYLFTSVLFLYLPLLPGIALCRDTLTDKPKWQRWMYKFMAIGWHGTDDQWKIMKRCVAILSVLVIPLAISIHTVTAWLFATTLRPGWDSTNFGPYFVAGAFQAGTACVIIGMFVFRRAYGLQKYITEVHFNNMGKLLLFLCLVYAYFNVNEYLIPAYKMRGPEASLLNDLFTGKTAPLYWFVQIVGMALPALFLLLPKARKPWPIAIISLCVVVGAWLKRYLIVTPILLHPYIPIQNVPANWAVYFPTLTEIAIVSGSLAGVLFIITMFSKFFPIISIWETLEGQGIDLEEMDHENAAHGTVEAAKAAPTGKILAIMLGVFMLLQLPSNKLYAENEKKATIKLSFAQTDSTRTCTAKVTANNNPVKGTEVHFYVKRLFRPLPINKAVETDENGEAVMSFPIDLPGDNNGNIIAIAKIEDDDTYGTVESQQEVKWGIIHNGEKDPWGHRSLSASREKAPMYLIIGSSLIIVVIWGTIFYIVFQVFKIKRAQ